MERDEAKAILELCRPGIADDHRDPLIAEALGLLETDAELKAWFDEQQALDSRIAKTFNEVEPPADLKAGILAGMRAHALQSESESEGESSANLGSFNTTEGSTTQAWQRKRFATSAFRGPQDLEPVETASGVPTEGSRSASWWRNPWIGIAAVVALLLTIITIPRESSSPQVASSGNQTLQASVPDMIQFLAREINNLGSRDGFEKASNEPEALQAYLASVGSPSPSKLPRALEGNPSMGCFTFDYNGVSMGMICFQYEQVVHLITVRKSDCPLSFQPETPTVYEVENQAFKAWTDENHVYILSTKGSKEKLPQVI